jgi:hypothetical protein
MVASQEELSTMEVPMETMLCNSVPISQVNLLSLNSTGKEH